MSDLPEAKNEARKEQEKRIRKRISTAADVFLKVAAACAVIAATIIANTYQSQMTAVKVLSDREQAESQLRSTMFNNLLDPIVGSKNDVGEIDVDRLKLMVELLALNFHEHFEFKPLLEFVHNKLEDADDKKSLRSIARRVIDRQITELVKGSETENGENPAYLYFPPDNSFSCTYKEGKVLMCTYNDENALECELQDLYQYPDVYHFPPGQQFPYGYNLPYGYKLPGIYQFSDRNIPYVYPVIDGYQLPDGNKLSNVYQFPDRFKFPDRYKLSCKYNKYNVDCKFPTNDNLPGAYKLSCEPQSTFIDKDGKGLVSISPDKKYTIGVWIVDNMNCLKSSDTKVKVRILIKSETDFISVPIFTLTTFDFPFTDNTRLDKDNRFALVFDNIFGNESAEKCKKKSEDKSEDKEVLLKLVWFPKGFVSPRERPINYSELRKSLKLDK